MQAFTYKTHNFRRRCSLKLTHMIWALKSARLLNYLTNSSLLFVMSLGHFYMGQSWRPRCQLHPWCYCEELLWIEEGRYCVILITDVHYRLRHEDMETYCACAPEYYRYMPQTRSNQWSLASGLWSCVRSCRRFCISWFFSTTHRAPTQPTITATYQSIWR